MTGSPFSFFQSKVKGRSWSPSISFDAIRRCYKSSRDCYKSSRDDSSSGAASPTSSSFSKKSKLFSKKPSLNLWKSRRESRDDFGNRWSKIYLPGHSRSATPLPEPYPENRVHCDYIIGNCGLDIENTNGLGYLEMMYDDHEIFEKAFHENSPYLSKVETPTKGRLSWISWGGSSLHLSSSRPPTRTMLHKTS
ncbi:hypothetical protein BDZ91DRAFT_792107 [Kalaharituber pfeilii]|nr:hypothetical protein BDZ91DRAFT_792107 [Kalaharituber pfeilii]